MPEIVDTPDGPAMRIDAERAGGEGVKGAEADPTWVGGSMSERAECVLCPNPSPMTLDGTNTWISPSPARRTLVVVDPGPLDEGHLARVMAEVEQTGRRVALTLLTHGHRTTPERPSASTS